MYDILIGTDPEVFLTDASGNFVSAHDLIPGSKHQPTIVNLGAIQPDGVSAEFNTDPAKDADEFIRNIKTVMSQMEGVFKSIRPDLMITITPTATFDKDYFDSLPAKATELGCTPDYNTYTEEQNEPPSTSEPFRTGAGHIHVGFGSGFLRADYEHFERCCNIVKQLDAVIYPASLLWDSDDKRRSLYGKIGSFRPKSYGVEWRPLSNAYLKDEKTQRYVFNTTKKLVDLLLNEEVEIFNDAWTIGLIDSIIWGDKPGEDTIRAYLQYIELNYGVPAYA